MHKFCLVSIKTHIVRMLELQPSPFFTDSLHELSVKQSELALVFECLITS